MQIDALLACLLVVCAVAPAREELVSIVFSRCVGALLVIIATPTRRPAAEAAASRAYFPPSPSECELN